MEKTMAETSLHRDPAQADPYANTVLRDHRAAVSTDGGSGHEASLFL